MKNGTKMMLARTGTLPGEENCMSYLWFDYPHIRKSFRTIQKTANKTRERKIKQATRRAIHPFKSFTIKLSTWMAQRVLAGSSLCAPAAPPWRCSDCLRAWNTQHGANMEPHWKTKTTKREKESHHNKWEFETEHQFGQTMKNGSWAILWQENG